MVVHNKILTQYPWHVYGPSSTIQDYLRNSTSISFPTYGERYGLLTTYFLNPDNKAFGKRTLSLEKCVFYVYYDLFNSKGEVFRKLGHTRIDFNHDFTVQNRIKKPKGFDKNFSKVRTI